MSDVEYLLAMGAQLLVSWAIGKCVGLSVNRVWNYIKDKKEEKKLDEIINGLCKEYGIDEDKLRNELKSLPRYNYIKNKLDEFNIDSNKFLKEYISRIFNELSKHKDSILINMLLNINSNIDELLEYFKDYEGIKELLDDYKRKKEAEMRSFEIGSSNYIKSLIRVESDIEYVHRDEDVELENAIDNHNIIIIEGKAGSGKSSMLRNAIDYCSNFDKFVYIKPFFSSQDDIITLDAELQKYDSFVIIWDDLHEVEIDLLRNCIRRINELHKRFKFIGASRSYIYLPKDADHRNVILKDFVNEELVRNCMSYYNVELDGIDTKDIIEVSDKTPNFIISLFIKFKNRKIDRNTRIDYSDTVELWKDYINELKEQGKIDDKDMDVLLSIALLNHAGSSVISNINDIYSNVFRREGRVEQIVKKLEEYHLITKNDEYYIMHDSHTEAVEDCYPLNETILKDFVKYYQYNIGKLYLLLLSFIHKFEDYHKILIDMCDDILEHEKSYTNIDNNYYNMVWNPFIDLEELSDNNPIKPSVLCIKGSILAEKRHFKEALKCFDEALELIDKNDEYIDITKGDILYCKAHALYDLQEYPEALKYFKLAMKEEPYNANILYHIGLTLIKMQNYYKAMSYFKLAYKYRDNMQGRDILLIKYIRMLYTIFLQKDHSNKTIEELIEELEKYFKSQ